MNAIPIQDSTEPRNYTSPPALDRLLTMNEVRRLTSLGRTTIYSMNSRMLIPGSDQNRQVEDSVYLLQYRPLAV